jgi:hypothetical protein
METALNEKFMEIHQSDKRVKTLDDGCESIWGEEEEDLRWRLIRGLIGNRHTDGHEGCGGVLKGRLDVDWRVDKHTNTKG